MKIYETNQIRNIALVGHAGSGKTSLAESLLFNSGVLNRRGSVEEKNTTSDFHPLEQDRSCSIFSSLMYFENKGNKINIIDTPGYDDYIGEMCAAIRVADTVLIAVSSNSGIEVGTENGWTYANKNNKATAFLLNRLDSEQPNFEETLSELKDNYGNSVTLIQYPLNPGPGFNSIVDLLSQKVIEYSDDGKKVTILDIPDSEKSTFDSRRSELIESIAETNEDLMNKYFDEGDLTADELINGLKTAMANRQIFPVLCSSTKYGVGSSGIADFFSDYCPSPDQMPVEITDNEKEHKINSNGNPSLFIFKMFSDAQAGDVTFFKVMQGRVKSGVDLINSKTSNAERLNQIYLMQGKKRDEVTELCSGDLGCTVKLKSTHLNDSLFTKGNELVFSKIHLPNPKTRISIVPVTKGEEEKVGMGLNAIHQEDPTLIPEHSQELRQMILYSQGELHQSVAKWKLENRFKVKTEFHPPRVPYRETIQKQVRGDYRHKKQSGGAGQFAEVHMLVEPWSEDAPMPSDINVRGKDLIKLDWGGHLEFVNCIVGGVIDQRFLPAILKGVMEKMQTGPLTGSYVRDIRVAIYDGKMHPVDSNEAAFKMAGSMVFKNNFINAAPKILEPIYNVDIKVPEDFVGDVMSDLPTRRGLILGIESEGRYQIIKARMPLAEVDRYATGLRSMTQGRATYSQEFVEYQAVPANVQQELMDAYKKQDEDE